MQSLLRSLTPEQRAELESMTDALLRDDRLRWDLAQLAANLDALMPEGLGDRYRFGGDQPLYDLRLEHDVREALGRPVVHRPRDLAAERAGVHVDGEFLVADQRRLELDLNVEMEAVMRDQLAHRTVVLDADRL